MASDSSSTQRLMVMLDAILDTRLGTVLRHQPEVAAELFNNAAYYLRANDDLRQIDSRIEAFAERYRARDAQVLADSVMTPMLYMVSEMAFQFEEQRANTPYVDAVVVQLNTFPYQLDPEVEELLAGALYNYLPYDTTLEVMRTPIETLTPAVLKSDYSCLILYDLAEWFGQHQDALQTCIIPTVTVMAPKLHANGQPAFGPEVFGEGFEHIDPYTAIQRFVSPVVGLEFVEVRQCCILRPEEAEYRYQRLLKRSKSTKTDDTVTPDP